MPEIVTVHKEGKFVEVRSFGHVSQEQLLRSRETVIRLCKANDLHRILIDARELESLPNKIDLFDFGAGFQRELLFLRAKLAVVSNDRVLADHLFVETVSRNRGTDLRVFKTIAQALAWLRT